AGGRGEPLPRRADARPDSVHAAGAGLEPLPHPDRGLVFVRLRDASWRGYPRSSGAQRGAGDRMSFVKTIESYRQGARTLPGRYYTAPEVFAEERERIFARHWICVGRDATLAAPGDYFVALIADESI